MLRHLARAVATGFALCALLLAGGACLHFNEEPSDEPDFQATITAALQSAEAGKRPSEQKGGAEEFIAGATPLQPTGTVPATPAATEFIGAPQPSPSPAATAILSLSDAQDPDIHPTQTPTPGPPSPVAPTATAQFAASAGEERPFIMFTGPLMDGKTFDLNDAMGTPTLLVFWAPW